MEVVQGGDDFDGVEEGSGGIETTRANIEMFRFFIELLIITFS